MENKKIERCNKPHSEWGSAFLCGLEKGHDGICVCSYDSNAPAIPTGPMPGTLAWTAKMMVEIGVMTGEEADAWKDEMKDAL